MTTTTVTPAVLPPWTDDTIKQEFERHIAYWQPRLRLQDYDFRVIVTDRKLGRKGDAWCSIERDNNEDNEYRAVVWVQRSAVPNVSQFEVWSTVVHEFVHLTLWPLANVADAFPDHFATAQINLINAAAKRWNEAIAYKYEAIFVEMCKADAPPKNERDS